MIPKLTTEHTENTECSVVDVIGLEFWHYVFYCQKHLLADSTIDFINPPIPKLQTGLKGIVSRTKKMLRLST